MVRYLASAEIQAAGIKAWARIPHVPRELTLNGWLWLESWVRRNLVLRVGVGFPLPVLLGSLGVFLVAAGRSLGRNSPASRGRGARSWYRSTVAAGTTLSIASAAPWCGDFGASSETRGCGSRSFPCGTSASFR